MSAEAYRAKAEAKLEEFQARIDGAKAKLKGASADARLDLERQVGAMEKKLASARKKAGELADSADDAWSDLTSNIEDAYEGMASAVKGFFSR